MKCTELFIALKGNTSFRLSLLQILRTVMSGKHSGEEFAA